MDTEADTKCDFASVSFIFVWLLSPSARSPSRPSSRISGCLSIEHPGTSSYSICVIYMNCRFSHTLVSEAAIMELPKGTKTSHEKGRLR